MRSLCTCAALAVATAFAHGRFADALLRSNGMQRSEEKIEADHLDETLEKDCLEKINSFRKTLLSGDVGYNEDSDITSGTETQTDLSTFLKAHTCSALQSGKYAHLVESDETLFVITAEKPAQARSREEWNCDAALEQWQSGFSAFKGKHPPEYKDYSTEDEEQNTDNPYADPNAAALASLLHKDAQKMTCGKLTECDQLDVLCYFKPSGVTKGVVPVDPALWHALEAQEKLKPTLKKDENEEDEEDILKAVNDARNVMGLDAFTSPSVGKAMKRVKRSEPSDIEIQDAVEKFLYTLTCDDIANSNISPSPTEKDEFTVIYHIVDGTDPPTMEEAVTYWQSGFDKLQYKRPPAFTKATAEAKTDSDSEDSAVEASDFYSDSAVAGYVSIMTDGTRKMACVVATGCEVPKADTLKSREEDTTSKSGLVCVVHKATLKNGEEPISEATWAKIMEQKGYPLPKFEKLAEDKNCLEEMNAVRTQEKLGLKAFVASKETKTSTDLALSSLMKNVTCPAIGGAATTKTETSKGPEFQITDGTTSLMYHSVADVSCSAAVEAWKKGFEKFTTAPPAYKPDETVYQDAAATNFVSLITDKDATITATCYSTGCATAGIVCELSPAALEKDKKPVSEETWTKYSEIGGETSGVAGVSKAALIGTVMMTLAAGVFFL